MFVPLIQFTVISDGTYEINDRRTDRLALRCVCR